MDCPTGKTRYPKRHRAAHAAKMLMRNAGFEPVKPYRCSLCGWWHLCTTLERAPRKPSRRTRPRRTPFRARSFAEAQALAELLRGSRQPLRPSEEAASPEAVHAITRKLSGET